MEFEALKIDLSGTAAQAPVESRCCVLTVSLFLATARSAVLSACRPGGCFFLTGPISLSPSHSGRLTDRLQEIWIPHDSAVKFCWWGGQGFCRKRFFVQEFASKAQWVAAATSRTGVFPGSVHIHAFGRGRLSFLPKDLYCSALRYLPPGRGDQILRRCMHTFECQLDSADRFGDVCRQSSVWLLKQTQSRVTNWATYCHPSHHNVGFG